MWTVVFLFVGLLCFWLFAVYAVVDNAGRVAFPAGMSAIVSAFHHPWGCACTSAFVQQPIGTPSLSL